MRLVLIIGLLGVVGCKRSKAPDNCVRMLACDAAYAVANDDYTQFYGGPEDVNFGDDGTCYEGSRRTCDTACSNAVDNLIVAAEAAVEEGALDAVPVECTE